MQLRFILLVLLVRHIQPALGEEKPKNVEIALRVGEVMTLNTEVS
jgi:hypothetical protein